MTEEEKIKLAEKLDELIPIGIDVQELLSRVRKTYHSNLLGEITFSKNRNPFGPSFYFKNERVADCVVDIHRKMHASFFYEGMPKTAVLVEWYNGKDIYCTRHENFLDKDEATIVAELEEGFKEAEETINGPCW